MKSKSDEWLEYQKLAASIYSELEPFAEVRHDDKIRGYDSGSLRQIDVSIRTNVAGHEVLIIVQARNRARKVDVNAVGELVTVMKDIRAAKAILISNAGFSQGARNLAAANNIDLCAIHDAKSSKWPLSISIPLLWVEIYPDLKLKCEIEPLSAQEEQATISLIAKEWNCLRSGHKESVFAAFASFWNDHPVHRELGRVWEWRADCNGLMMQISSSDWARVIELSIQYQVKKRGWAGKLKLSDCKAIANHSTQEFRTRLSLANFPIPIVRDEKWMQIDDPDSFERSAQDLVLLECSGVDVDTLVFSVL